VRIQRLFSEAIGGSSSEKNNPDHGNSPGKKKVKGEVERFCSTVKHQCPLGTRTPLLHDVPRGTCKDHNIQKSHLKSIKKLKFGNNRGGNETTYHPVYHQTPDQKNGKFPKKWMICG